MLGPGVAVIVVVVPFPFDFWSRPRGFAAPNRIGHRRACYAPLVMESSGGPLPAPDFPCFRGARRESWRLSVFVRFFEINDVLLHKTPGSYCVTIAILREPSAKGTRHAQGDPAS